MNASITPSTQTPRSSRWAGWLVLALLLLMVPILVGGWVVSGLQDFPGMDSVIQIDDETFHIGNDWVGWLAAGVVVLCVVLCVVPVALMLSLGVVLVVLLAVLAVPALILALLLSPLLLLLWLLWKLVA
jgi:hypothetical protein